MSIEPVWQYTMFFSAAVIPKQKIGTMQRTVCLEKEHSEISRIASLLYIERSVLRR